MHSTLRFLHYFLDYPCIVTHHNHHKHKIIFQKFIQQCSYSKPKEPLTSKCSKLFLQRSNCEFVKPSRSAKASIIKVTTERSRVWIEPCGTVGTCWYGEGSIWKFKKDTKTCQFWKGNSFLSKATLGISVLNLYGFLGFWRPQQLRQRTPANRWWQNINPE